MFKRAAKAVIAALGAGASAATAVAVAGGPDRNSWLTAIALAFVTGAITYRVPNKPRA